MGRSLPSLVRLSLFLDRHPHGPRVVHGRWGMSHDGQSCQTPPGGPYEHADRLERGSDSDVAACSTAVAFPLASLRLADGLVQSECGWASTHASRRLGKRRHGGGPVRRPWADRPQAVLHLHVDFSNEMGRYPKDRGAYWVPLSCAEFPKGPQILIAVKNWIVGGYEVQRLHVAPAPCVARLEA